VVHHICTVPALDFLLTWALHVPSCVSQISRPLCFSRSWSPLVSLCVRAGMHSSRACVCVCVCVWVCVGVCAHACVRMRYASVPACLYVRRRCGSGKDPKNVYPDYNIYSVPVFLPFVRCPRHCLAYLRHSHQPGTRQQGAGISSQYIVRFLYGRAYGTCILRV
jgi:hypothetical protein